jgi:hypothetical protein
MAVIFAEQSETGSAAWLQTVGDWSANTTNWTAGPWSTYSLRAGDTAGCIALWTAAVAEFWGQARWYFADLSNAQFMKFFSPNGVVNLSYRRNISSNRLEIYRGDGTTLLATGTTTTFTDDRAYYFQLHHTISDTTGTVEVWIDGVAEGFTFVTGTSTTQDTQNGAAETTCDRIGFDTTAANFLYVDDVVINDSTDTDNTGLPDRLGIEALMPSAAGDNTGLSRGGTDSGANWSQVDERPPNDATDYVFDSVVNDYDLYNLPSTRWDSVAAVLLSLRAQNSDAGGGSIAHMLKVDTDASGTADTEDQGADVAQSTTWTNIPKIYNRQPGPTSWSPAKVNALQAGVKCR